MTKSKSVIDKAVENARTAARIAVIIQNARYRGLSATLTAYEIMHALNAIEQSSPIN